MLLNLSPGPERDQHIYSFGNLNPGVITNEQTPHSQPASKHHLNDLIEFYSNNDMLIDAENRLPAILSRGRACFVRQENKIISCAMTTTETNDAAMIGAVFTNPAYRHHGYAKECLLNLYRALIADYKKPYLFYPANSVLLRKIYGSLGFNQTNIWLLATKCYRGTLSPCNISRP